MSRPESPVKVKISEIFVFAERAKVLSWCTGMVCNRSALPEVGSASHVYVGPHGLVWGLGKNVDRCSGAC